MAGVALGVIGVHLVLHLTAPQWQQEKFAKIYIIKQLHYPPPYAI
jgi:hypothetical protein